MRLGLIFTILLMANVSSADTGSDHRTRIQATDFRLSQQDGVDFTARLSLNKKRLQNSKSISLRLPDGRFTAKRTLLTKRKHGFSWFGKINNQSLVNLTSYKGFISGRIHTPNSLYAVVTDRHKKTWVRKVKTDQKMACVSHESHAPAGLSKTAHIDPEPPIDDVDLDLLVVYTPAALVTAGGEAQMIALMQSAVDATNQSYSGSDVSIKLNLVDVEMINYTESGHLPVDIFNNRQDGSEAVNLRNQLGADVVSIVVNDAVFGCGFGDIQGSSGWPLGEGLAPFAFNALNMECDFGFGHLLAHELGHNQGAEHEPADTTIPPDEASFPFSYGHDWNTGVQDLGTIMADWWVPLFSNPQIYYYDPITQQSYQLGIFGSGTIIRPSI
ncbi:MAG: hypothetical protein GKR90_26860 [Pseudomonadales bacterium]|nr:hypothetical protein [Pseudomonadales bacterium]